MSVFGKGLHDKTNADVVSRNYLFKCVSELSLSAHLLQYESCVAHNNPHQDAFSNDTNSPEINIFTGGVFLGCQFGIAAMYIWAIGILAAGQSSTMAGCYAGQFVMEVRTVCAGSTYMYAVFPLLCPLGGFNVSNTIRK